MKININNIYEKSILHEVIFEARFPLNLNIDKKIGDFQEIIQKRYPSARKGINPILDDKIWRFSNKDQEEISIFQDKMTLKLKRYDSWVMHDNKNKLGFKNQIVDFVENFKKIWKIPIYTRIGLRFINKYEFQQNKFSTNNFKKLFIPIFNIKKYPLEKLRENRLRLRKICKNDKIITIQSVFEFRKNNFDSFYLDFDSFITDLEPSKFKNNLEELHDNIIYEFESLITDELRKEMKLID